MYKCLECGAIFEEGSEAVWQETHGLDTPPYETLSGCPICKGAYEEAPECKLCGNYKNVDNESYCEECKNDIKERFQRILHLEFDKDEIELLNVVYEDKEMR